MAKLTPDQWKVGQAWLHDVFIWGGLVPVANARRPISQKDYYYMYGDNNSRYDKPGANAATTICNFIKFRPVKYQNFVDVDTALDRLSRTRFLPDLHAQNNYSIPTARKKVDMLAKYIAYFVADRKYYLDDGPNSGVTTFEMDQIKQTIIGKALWDYGCFISQAKTSTPASGGTRAPSNRQPGQAPQNNYKASGAQSANVKCLVGQPNNKLSAQSAISYCIEADKIGKNTPNAFIKPLDAKACPNGTAVVYMGSGNGYTDCKCWFDDLNNANNFLTQVQNKFGSKFTNIHISKAKSDANGYYVAHTEFGDCGIKASKLNEQLKEADEAKAKESNIFDKLVIHKGSNYAEAFEDAMFDRTK